MQQKLKTILEESKKQLERATSLKEAEETRIKVLGKKGALTEILRSMGRPFSRGKKRTGTGSQSGARRNRKGAGRNCSRP